MDIRGEYDIVYGDEVCGTAVVIREGIRSRVKGCVKNFFSTEPFRIAVVSGEKVIPLGIMMPDGDGFCFERLYSNAALRELGMGAIDRFTLMTAKEKQEAPQRAAAVNSVDHGWQRTTSPAELLREGEFRHVFLACHEGLVRSEDGLSLLAVPILKEEPFPVMPVFRLGEIWKIGGRLHMVFRIRDGKLLF